MIAFVVGLGLLAATVGITMFAVPRTRSGKGVTGIGWVDDLLPVTVLSFAVIGIALVANALLR